MCVLKIAIYYLEKTIHQLFMVNLRSFIIKNAKNALSKGVFSYQILFEFAY